jgi:hypothetical protein
MLFQIRIAAVVRVGWFARSANVPILNRNEVIAKSRCMSRARTSSRSGAYPLVRIAD